MKFDSHVRRLLDAAARLVNAVTPGESGGRPAVVPQGRELTAAVARAVSESDYRPRPSAEQAAALAGIADAVRRVFEAAAAGNDARAAKAVNALIAETQARPRLNREPDGSWNLHFHGPTEGFAVGWAAGLAMGLAMALGVDESGRLGVCAADHCDRVYVDSSRNGRRAFCSTRCQNRVKAAAHRARGQSGA